MRIAFEGLRIVLCAGVTLGLVTFAAVAEPAQGGQASPPAAPATPIEPSPSHVATARALVVASGLSRSFAVMIPQFMDQITTNLTQTRPELATDLDTVLKDLAPEFARQADQMIDIAARIYTKRISEPDLKTAVAFFESPAGRTYVETQPAFLGDVVAAMQGWRGKVSTDMMTRVRAEMKKKGHEI